MRINTAGRHSFKSSWKCFVVWKGLNGRHQFVKNVYMGWKGKTTFYLPDLILVLVSLLCVCCISSSLFCMHACCCYLAFVEWWCHLNTPRGVMQPFAKQFLRFINFHHRHAFNKHYHVCCCVCLTVVCKKYNGICHLPWSLTLVDKMFENGITGGMTPYFFTIWWWYGMTDWLTDWLNEWMNEWMNEWQAETIHIHSHIKAMLPERLRWCVEHVLKKRHGSLSHL